ncbi:PREDICTED: peroxisomal 2,4-dienoyl-CoA reductase-like [Condylura cristata]|uniref:peroxisomal 2,4-dienoyl-CoA reductase-like n=1 Tax=Condylura cristata TaxID=143302 RepID=UPI000642FBC9|nr:PREDICTED: peroxisomal 2,4-dienoyl-CoA reductase-like [Condylura cristata]
MWGGGIAPSVPQRVSPAHGMPEAVTVAVPPASALWPPSCGRPEDVARRLGGSQALGRRRPAPPAPASGPWGRPFQGLRTRCFSPQRPAWPRPLGGSPPRPLPAPFPPGAAGNFLCPASGLSFNAFKTVLDIDTLGTFNVSRVLHEKFFREHGGVIVNITATLGMRGWALQLHAGSAKAAVDAMTRHLAVEWGPQDIRVNSLAPGPISGTEGLRRLGGPEASVSRKAQASPLRRLGNKTEVAHAALYLASPLASYVTGALLVVDGGAWLTLPNGPQLQDGSALPLARL